MTPEQMKQAQLNAALAQKIGFLEMELVAAQVEIDALRREIEALKAAPE